MDVMRAAHTLPLLVSLFALLSASERALATDQFPEVLIYGGQKKAMMAEPLEQLLRARSPRQDFWDNKCFNTACHRGYIGSWEIKNRRLYLFKVLKWPPEEGQDLFSVVFPNQKPPVLAEWCSGVLVVAPEDIYSARMREAWQERVYVLVHKGMVIGEYSRKAAFELWSDTSTPATNAAISSSVFRNLEMLDLSALWERTEELNASQKVFRTKGIYFPGKLWIPPYRTEIHLVLDKKIKEPEVGSFIEVTATLRGSLLVVESVQELLSAEKRKALHSDFKISPR